MPDQYCTFSSNSVDPRPSDSLDMEPTDEPVVHSLKGRYKHDLILKLCAYI